MKTLPDSPSLDHLRRQAKDLLAPLRALRPGASLYLCASMSWLMSRIRIALTEADAEARELADRAVPWLLKEPPSQAAYQAVLDAVR